MALVLLLVKSAYSEFIFNELFLLPGVLIQDEFSQFNFEGIIFFLFSFSQFSQSFFFSSYFFFQFLCFLFFLFNLIVEFLTLFGTDSFRNFGKFPFELFQG